MVAVEKEKKLTQQEVGEGTGLSTSSIGMYEQGRRKPSFDVLKTLKVQKALQKIQLLPFN